MIYLGLLINPKTKQPVHAAMDGNRVWIFGWVNGELKQVGSGYYGDDEGECTRSHTPDGVIVKGYGFGTCLYAALAMGTMHRNRKDIDEACIYSIHGDRSHLAESWWSAAVDSGLAEEDSIDTTEEFEDEDWSDYIDASSLVDWNEDVTDISSWHLSVSGERGGSLDINRLTLQSVAEHGLLALAAETGRYATNVTREELLENGFVPIAPHAGDEWDNVIWPNDEEEAAPLLAMNKEGLPRAFKNYLRRLLVDKAEVAPEKIAAAGLAVPTDSERYGGKQLELIDNPGDEVAQVKRIWRNLASLP